MNNFFALLLSIILLSIASASFAQETAVVNESAQVEKTQKTPESLAIEKTPQVGKHVMANMDASSMIMSLLMVLGLIIISALILKRFNLAQQSSNHMKVIASLSLGPKERVVVIQIGEQQLLLGVCPQQVSLLDSLKEPLDIQVTKPLALSGNILSFLQKNGIKKNTDSNAVSN